MFTEINKYQEPFKKQNNSNNKHSHKYPNVTHQTAAPKAILSHITAQKK